jgi:hypothetical protein
MPSLDAHLAHAETQVYSKKSLQSYATIYLQDDSSAVNIR